MAEAIPSFFGSNSKSRVPSEVIGVEGSGVGTRKTHKPTPPNLSEILARDSENVARDIAQDRDQICCAAIIATPTRNT
jgi:hypothetical protein